MAWGVRWYLVGSIVLGLLGALAGCSGGGFFAERAPWRHEAEVQCLNAGAVKEGAGIVRIRPIRGPGVCGADFPLKVSTLGESGPLGYSDDLRPPADIPRGSPRPRWPIRPAEPPYQSRVLPDYQVGWPQPRRDIAPDEPVSLNPPGVSDQPGVAAEPYDFRRPYGVTPAAPPPKYRAPPLVASPRDDFSPEPYERRPLVDGPGPLRNAPRAATREPPPPPGPLGPARIPPTASFTPVAVSPPATLACPIVSELERFRARLRQRARHRGVHARRRTQDHGEERLARPAGGAGFSARRAGHGLRSIQHGAGARLERLSLRPYPRRFDASARRPSRVQPARRVGRRGGRARRALRDQARPWDHRLARTAPVDGAAMALRRGAARARPAHGRAGRRRRGRLRPPNFLVIRVERSPGPPLIPAHSASRRA